ncbi:ATP-binding protein [Devosia limi]|uniref:ATP-binding protein n=1 Tax=Devosia limi TaxID=288995 RepID=UPI000699AAC4|nr:ATP-binding protein [Devosia limi]
MPKHRFGIGMRLFVSFVIIVGLAAGASVVGWLSYARLSGELEQIAQSELPRLSLASRLSRVGADISAVLPSLARSERAATYEAARAIYSDRLVELREVIAEAERNGIGGGELDALAEEITDQVQRMDGAVGVRFALLGEMRSLVDELRWVQADLLEEAGPLVDDIRFNVEKELADFTGAAPLLAENQKSEALLTVVAQANLATGLISRVSGVTTAEDMQEAVAFLGDSTDELAARVQSLTDWPDSITVRQLAGRILEIADNRDGIPHLKQLELEALAEAQRVTEENQRLVEQLGEEIRAEVSETERNAEAAAVRARQAIETGRRWLLLIAVLAITSAILIGYFYVYRSLLLRIRHLANAAANIAEGKSGTLIQPQGRDELGDLATALNIFRRTRDDLIQSAKLAALGQMAAGIGHELNQPLAAIQSHSHNGVRLIEQGKVEMARQSLEKIKGLTGRMAGQISHLRRFARRPETRLGPVALDEPVNAAVSLLSHRFEDEDVVLEVEMPTGMPAMVTAESVRLEQVVVNLLANALDAVSGLDTRHVRLVVTMQGETVMMAISDTGGGIPHSHRDVVFDPFFTTKAPGSGLGLGLSISYNIIKDFNGSIAVRQTNSTGTTFLVTLERAS